MKKQVYNPYLPLWEYVPDGGFTYGGMLHSNGDVGVNGNDRPKCYWGNNHGSIERINGKYYIFGHRQTNYHEFSRQAVAEELRFEDGRFLPAEMTSCGLNGGPLKGEGTYPAVIACNLYGRKGACKTTKAWDKRVHPCFTQERPDGETDGGNYIRNITHGTVIGYKYFDLAGAGEITLCLRGKGDGVFLVSHGEDGAPIATVPVKAADGWTEVTAPAAFASGKQPLYFRFAGLGSFDLKSFTLK